MSQSMSSNAEKPAKKKSELRETIIVVIEALLIALVFRTFLYQPFSIPTASMQSTLMIGDYFVASKFTWGFGKYSFPISLPFNGRFLTFNEPKIAAKSRCSTTRSPTRTTSSASSACRATASR
jgi:signal peptidase I